MTAARRMTESTTTAGTATAYGAHDATNGATQARTAAPPTRGTPSAHGNVFQPPLSAGGADSARRQRAQRKQLATQAAAVGTIAALVTVAFFAWRRARR